MEVGEEEVLDSLKLDFKNTQTKNSLAPPKQKPQTTTQKPKSNIP